MKKQFNNANWFEGKIPAKSLRSIFRWGDPDQYKHPNSGLVELMKERLGVTVEQLETPVSLGLSVVEDKELVGLSEGILQRLEEIVGEENLQIDTYSRVRASYGQGMIDSIRLREGLIENLPDVVLHPRDKADVARIVDFCNREGLPLYVVSGRSSVTRGYEAVRGGVTIDVSTHMNKVLEINEKNQTVVVQPGIFGPAFEQELNADGYTCGHFPQSFEFSTVGGWVSARSAGRIQLTTEKLRI